MTFNMSSEGQGNAVGINEKGRGNCVSVDKKLDFGI